MNMKKALTIACVSLAVLLAISLYVVIDMADGGISYSPYDDAPYIPDGVRYGREFEDFDSYLRLMNLGRIDKEVNGSPYGHRVVEAIRGVVRKAGDAREYGATPTSRHRYFRQPKHRMYRRH